MAGPSCALESPIRLAGGKYMTRTFTGLCAATAFGLVVTAGAQTNSSTDQQSRRGNGNGGREITVTGCLQRSSDGIFTLANAMMDHAGSGAASTSTAGT